MYQTTARNKHSKYPLPESVQHGHVSSWKVTAYVSPRGGFEWFDRHKNVWLKCLMEAYF
jgi:hypothetical protein